MSYGQKVDVRGVGIKQRLHGLDQADRQQSLQRIRGRALKQFWQHATNRERTMTQDGNGKLSSGEPPEQFPLPEYVTQTNAKAHVLTTFREADIFAF